MKEDRVFVRCNVCGNIAGMIEVAGPRMVCCGKEMEQLKPNTSDGATEKHVPVAVKNDDVIEVQVGSAPHPMTKEHHIAWIMIAGEGWTERTQLSHTGEPKASFCVKKAGPVTVYEYCNIHGLWAAELK